MGWSGRSGKGDVMAEGFELVDQAAGVALFVDPLFVIVGPEVFEGNGGVGEQVEDDHRVDRWTAADALALGIRLASRR